MISMFEPRFYRDMLAGEAIDSYQVCYKETDLYIRSSIKLMDLAYNKVRKLRLKLDKYIENHHHFAESLLPVHLLVTAPVEVKKMAEASALAGVGPMAAVAGLFAEEVGKLILTYTDRVLVENGGDIFIKSPVETKIGIFAGENSPFSGKLSLKIPSDQSLGICTSSGTMGPSLSFGKADSVTIISPSTPLADAAATAVCNHIRTEDDIDGAINWCQGIDGITGVVIIINDKIGIWGNYEIEKVKRGAGREK